MVMKPSFGSLALACVFLVSGIAAGNPPVASYIFPAGGQRGKTVNVKVGGLFLHDRCSFTMTGTGIQFPRELQRTSTLWLEGPLLPLPDSQRQQDYPKDMAGRLKIAADAPLGVRHWRVGTSQGVTPSGRFIVGDLPEVIEEELPGAPIPVPVQLPVTVNGRIFPHEDVDVWSFPCRKGQTVTCAVEAARLGSPLDARLEVLDPEGKSLAENDDALGADPRLRFTAPAEGTYRVRIHDINFKGSQAHVYRLTLTSGPYIDRVYPLGGRRGSRVAFTLTGQGLPPGPVTVALPATGPAEYSHTFVSGGARSNQVLLDLDDLPEYLEPAKETPTGESVQVPAVVSGRISRPGEIDRWVFPAQKGQTFELQLRAQRLGSALTGTLIVQDEKEKVLSRAEAGASGKPDPVLTFTAPADGKYTVQVASRFQSLGGLEHAYRLRIAHSSPDFRLRLVADAVTVNRGSQGKLRVFVDRTGGLREPIALSFKGLPPGVTVTPTTIPAGRPSVDLQVKAATEAKIQTFPLTIKGKVTTAGREITRTAGLPGERGVPDLDVVWVAVAMPTPFKVVGKYEMGWAARGSVGRRHFTIERNGFEGPLTVSLTDRQARHLQGVTGPTIIVPAGKNEFDYPVKLPPWMEIGRTCRVCVMAVGVIKDADGSKHTVSFSSVNQNEQYVAVIEAGRLAVRAGKSSLRAEPGTSVDLPVTIARARGLSGPVKLELVIPGHIQGVTANTITIPDGQTTGTLTVRFTGKQPGPFNMPLLVRATLVGKYGPMIAEEAVEMVP
jgi:Bacterial pre-peptidase C-terminal domain